MKDQVNLLQDSRESVKVLLNDPSIFEGLNAGEMKRVRKFLKGVDPYPEHKDDLPWLMELMNENIQATSGSERVSGTDDRYRLITKLRGQGLTLKQVGEKIGLSGTRVSGILRSSPA